MQHVFLVDGSGFIFRAFHALPPMTRKDGTPVNANEFPRRHSISNESAKEIRCDSDQSIRRKTNAQFRVVNFQYFEESGAKYADKNKGQQEDGFSGEDEKKDVYPFAAFHFHGRKVSKIER